MMDGGPVISQDVSEQIHEDPIWAPNWKSRFSKNLNVSAMKLKYMPPIFKDGKPVVSLSSEEFVDQMRKCKQMLVGSFVGQGLSLNLVKDTLWMLWKPEGKIKMSSYGYSVYIFEFEDEKDRVTAMEMTPIYIASQLFVIQPWRPFIEVELLSHYSLPMMKNKHIAERRELGYVRYFHRRPILCSWLRPNEGWYMINTDGSFSNDGAGYGAIIRDNNAVVVAAVAGSVRPSSTIVHEIQAIKAGLWLAYSNHLTRVVVATDSTEATRIISNRNKAPYYIDTTGILSEWKKPPPRYISSLMRRIEAICFQFEEIVVRHVYRETNRAADHLSRLLPSSHFVEILPSSFSEDLKEIVFEDSIGKVYERSTLGGKALDLHTHLWKSLHGGL